MKKLLIAIATFTALLATFLPGPVSSAYADSLADDARITSITFNSPNSFDLGGRRDSSGLYPSFSPDKYNYQIATVANIFDVNAVLSDPLATMKMTFEGVTGDAQSSVDYRINMQPKVSLLDIEVTAQDGVTKKHYKVNISNQVMQTPEILSTSVKTTSVLGGNNIFLKLRNVNLSNWGYPGHTVVSCYADLSITYLDPATGNIQTYGVGLSYSNESRPDADADGVTAVTAVLPALAGNFLGEAQLTVKNYCYNIASQWGDWTGVKSESTNSQILTVQPFSIADVVTPSVVSGGSFIEVKGTHIYFRSNLSARLRDVASDQTVYIESFPISDSKGFKTDTWRGALDRTQRQSAFQSAGKKLLEIGRSTWDPINYEYSFEVLFSKTVNWKPVVPSGVTISPAKSDVSGGKRVRVEGYDLCNSYGWPHGVNVKIDGKPLTNIEMQYSNTYCGSAVDYATQKPQKQYFTALVPAGDSTGTKSVTVDNGNGEVRVAATFTYGATPVITSISPSSVAATGGSKVRITGTNFGFSGSPIVIIGGKKSPKVTLISDQQVDVIVPFDLPTGNQSVSIISSSGGGANVFPGTLNVVAASQNPSILSLSTSQGLASGGDVITLSVSNVGTPSAVGVMFGINPAEVTRATASQIDVKVPAGVVGSVAVTLSSALGQVEVPAAYTYSAIPAVKSVSPSTVASTADVADRTVTITGNGFGPSGKIKVGQQPEQSYISTDAGTKISGIVIPNQSPGSLSILITPTGSLIPLASSVTVTKPNITYVGLEADQSIYNLGCNQADWSCYSGNNGATKPSFSKLGGDVLKIKGTGFGNSGTVKFGTKTVTPYSFTDTEILVTVPALNVGSYDLTVVPSSGLQTDVLASAFSSVEIENVTPLSIVSVIPTVPNTRGDLPYNFDPSQDFSSVFEISGTGFLGSDNGASTKLYQLEDGGDPRYDSSSRVPVRIISITDTAITFSALRTFAPVRWTGIGVQTSEAITFTQRAIRYVGSLPAAANISGSYGLCTKDPIKTHNPAVVNVSGSGMFGDSGVVKLSGQVIDSAAVTWTADGVSVDFSKLPTDLAEHWGQKTLEFIPADTTLITRQFGWFCGVWAEVVTKINGLTTDQTINAGTDYVASADFPSANRLDEVVPTGTWPADGYQYQSAQDHGDNAWVNNVRSGLPTYAGDWYIRANPGVSTPLIDRTRYVGVSSTEVHLTISGKQITFTPKLKGSNATSITYRGQLGDGTFDSEEDITYNVSVEPGSPAITKVVWEYRNNSCTLSNNSYGWSEGLPGNVAIVPNECGGDGTAVSSWDIRVRSFEMTKDGKNLANLFLPTYNTFNLTIEKRALTIDKVTANKSYDGNPNIPLGALTVTGALEGESPSLQGNESRNGYFSDANVGENKPVYVSGTDGQTDFIQRIQLEGIYAWNYYLTNSELLVLGSITKANARLSLSTTNKSLIMGVVDQATISTSVLDTASGNPPVADADIADVVVTVSTPSICSISSDLVVTALATGECVVEASQPASKNYNAATAASDSESVTESLTITVYATPKKVSLITQDLTISEGETPTPSYEVLGLEDGDTLDSVVYEYYDGVTKLDAAPTVQGRYTMVATSANISTTNLAAYDASIEFVAGILVVTPPPPTVTSITPPTGSEAGGEQIAISGSGLSAITSIVFGNVTIPSSGFVVNGDGTEISLVAPPGTGNVTITLIAGDTELLLDYSYNPYVATVTNVAPLTGPETGGNRVVITGTHLEKVTEVRLGTTVITSGNLTRNQSGSSISFNALPGTGTKNIVLVTSSGSYSFEYVYTGVTVVGNPRLSLQLVKPQFGHRLSDHTVKMSAKDLKPGATYTLTMYSRATTMVIGKTSATGSINGSMTIPTKACKTPGMHKLVLSSTDATGAKHESSVYVVLGKKCQLNAVAEKVKGTSWNISGILFDYQKWNLSSTSKATLKALKPWLKNAKSVKVSGYTETDGKGNSLKVLNKILAKKRSQSVISYLKKMGVNARLVVDPVGAKNPASSTQSKNRRVEINATF
jgi:outer membrane protein OmpA-like peptidoglycan-associated protein